MRFWRHCWNVADRQMGHSCLFSFGLRWVSVQLWCNCRAVSEQFRCGSRTNAKHHHKSSSMNVEVESTRRAECQCSSSAISEQFPCSRSVSHMTKSEPHWNRTGAFLFYITTRHLRSMEPNLPHQNRTGTALGTSLQNADEMSHTAPLMTLE